jgi:hypothetical protein
MGRAGPGRKGRVAAAFASASVFVILLCGAANVFAQRDALAAEYRVKAAFLYKFSAFVEWPPGVLTRPEQPFVIGVLNADALVDELVQVVAGRTVKTHPVAVRRLKPGDALDGVHMLFVGRSDVRRLTELLAPARGRPTLVVTESSDWLAAGSMINFVIVDDKVRFDVAPPSAEQGALHISARLLTVARKVVMEPS